MNEWENYIGASNQLTPLKNVTFGLVLGGEPDPRHLQKIAVAASFRT